MPKEGPALNQQEYHSSVKNAKVAVVVAQWNNEITDVLANGAIGFLKSHGLSESNILVERVSGAFELPLGAQLMQSKVDALVCIGCLVKGETPHFQFISEAVTQELSSMAVRLEKPVAYGLLTVNSWDQAEARAGGKFGNKGEEAAEAALSLLSLKGKLAEQ